jgi:ribosomal protein L7/L12
MYLMIDQDDTGKVFIVVCQGSRNNQELFRMTMPEACNVLLIEHKRQQAMDLRKNESLLIAVKALLQAKQYVPAIAMVRKMLDLSLLDAKKFVDDIRDEIQNIRDAERDWRELDI